MAALRESGTPETVKNEDVKVFFLLLGFVKNLMVGPLPLKISQRIF